MTLRTGLGGGWVEDASTYIPVLIASTGSNFDAEIAGRIPEINPIPAAKEVPKSILEKLKTNSKSSAFVRTIAIIQTNNNPITPPKRDKITASNKNWYNIKLFLAPKAF